jgi:hypothetical protein
MRRALVHRPSDPTRVETSFRFGGSAVKGVQPFGGEDLARDRNTESKGGDRMETVSSASRPFAVVTGASSATDSLKAEKHRKMAEHGSAKK